ncbi:MAG: discoidin domain-containing protein [Polyangiaceae bacterium]
MALGFIRERLGAVRELFVLERAEGRSSRLTALQRATAKPHFMAATRRFVVAQELRQSATIEALVLLREATLHYAASFLASIDSRGEGDAAAPAPASTLEMLDRVVEASPIRPPAAFPEIRQAMASSDSLAFDRLSAVEANTVARDLDAVSRWLASLVELRSPRDIRRARIWRFLALFVVCGGLVAGVAVVVARAIAPKDLAFKKPVGATAVAFDTKPEGAVDGEKTGKFGYHSKEDDSAYLVVYLERRVKIARVKVFGRGDCCYDQSIPLALEVSDDGSTFRKIADRITPFSESDPWEVHVGPLVTRFVRLRVLQRGVLVLSEVEVYDR